MRKVLFANSSIFCITVLMFYSMTIQADRVAEKGDVWFVVQGDRKDGSALEESHWGWSRSPQDVVCKKFQVDVSDIKGFKLHYKMGFDPYDPETGKHSGDKLGNISILVNDKLAVDKPAKELASKGWHSLELDTSLIKAGENTVKFTWTTLKAGQADRHYGIIYMAIDNLARPGRSSSSRDGGVTFTTDNLQAGGKPREKTQGELLMAMELLKKQ